MKKVLFSIILTGVLFVSCGDNQKTAKTTKAADVAVVKNTKTTIYNKIDASSQIAWRATHLGGASPRFGFIKPSGIEFLVNEGTLTNAKVKIAINSLTVTSFPAGDDQIADLTKHLKSADFFNTVKYPNATFELTSTTPATGNFNTVVTGNLTILDKTKSITFKANIQVNDDNVTLKSEKFTVNRKDWGLTYHTEGTVGVPKDYLIADAIGFEIDVKATK
jgi:polyisoprenoid-binding protein YceI